VRISRKTKNKLPRKHVWQVTRTTLSTKRGWFSFEDRASLKGGFRNFYPDQCVQAPDPLPSRQDCQPYDNTSYEIFMKTLQRKEMYAPTILAFPIRAIPSRSSSSNTPIVRNFTPLGFDKLPGVGRSTLAYRPMRSSSRSAAFPEFRSVGR
jgi:hypothetical protein